MFTWRIFIDLVLEELECTLVHVITQTSNAPMPEELNFVVEFEHLRVLLLSKLVSILLVHVGLLPVFVIVIVVIVVLVEEGVVVIVLAVEIRSLDQVLIIDIASILHGIILCQLEIFHCLINLIVIKRGLDVKDAPTLA